MYVLRFLPRVQADILKNGVTIQGFQPGYTKLTLLGSSDGIYESYLLLSKIFDQHVVVKSACVGRLVPSAQKRISLENLPAVLCAHNESGAICYADYYSNSHIPINILICGQGEVPSKVATILSQPDQQQLVLNSIDVVQKLKSLPECGFDQMFHKFGVFIQELTFKPALLIQGYIQAEVNEAFSILSRAARRFATSTDSTILPGMAHSEKFVYNCHPKYKSQIQEHVTEPLQKNLKVSFLFNDLVQSLLSPVKDSSSSNNKTSFEILVQSNTKEDFNHACQKLKVRNCITLYNYFIILFKYM